MSSGQRFFRWVWRINALLILVAAAAAVCGVVTLVVSEVQSNIRRREAVKVAPPVVASSEAKQLRLGGFTNVRGSVFRALLTSESESSRLSSGYSSDTRNVLFVDLTTGTGRWLLPTDDQVITVDQNLDDEKDHTVLATVYLVKAYANGSAAETGRLLVADVAAEHVTEVAKDVQNVHGVTLTPTGEIAVLFERARNYEVALVDKSSLRKISEHTIAIPELK